MLNEISSATVQVHIKTASPLLTAMLKHHSIQYEEVGQATGAAMIPGKRFRSSPSQQQPREATSCLLPALVIRTLSRNNRPEQLLFYLGPRTLQGGAFCTGLQLERKPNGLRPSPLMAKRQMPSISTID